MANLDEYPKPHLFTREEYYALDDIGLFQDERVELIEGKIFKVPRPSSAHVVAAELVCRSLRPVFPTGHWIRQRGPLNLGGRSEPEPDIAAVHGVPSDYQDHPTSALLIIEVSESTLSFDRTRKSRLYAQAGISDYWILNLVDRQLEVRRTPRQDSPNAWSYADTRTLTPADTISPLAAPAASIRVADLLP